MNTENKCKVQHFNEMFSAMCYSIQLSPLVPKSLSLKYCLFWKSPASICHFLCIRIIVKLKSLTSKYRLSWNQSAELIMCCLCNCYIQVPLDSCRHCWWHCKYTVDLFSLHFFFYQNKVIVGYAHSFNSLWARLFLWKWPPWPTKTKNFPVGHKIRIIKPNT